MALMRDNVGLNPTDELAFSLQPLHITKVLFLIIALLLAAHVSSEAIQYVWWPDWPLKRFLSLDSEMNPSALFSVMQLILCAIVQARISASFRGTQLGSYWRVLAALFVVLAIDEGAMLHEKGTRMTSTIIGSTPLIDLIGWVVPGAIAVIIFGTVMVPFLRQLPRRTTQLFLIAGAMFVVGAVCIESANGLWYLGAMNHHSNNALRFVSQMFVAAEETLEMSGISLFIYALLDFCQRNLNGAAVLFRAGV